MDCAHSYLALVQGWTCKRPLPDGWNPVVGVTKHRVWSKCEEERNSWTKYKRVCGPNGDFFEAK
jgi:hypothetical protein